MLVHVYRVQFHENREIKKNYMSKSCISEAYKYIYSQNSFLELLVDWTV